MASVPTMGGATNFYVGDYKIYACTAHFWHFWDTQICRLCIIFCTTMNICFSIYIRRTWLSEYTPDQESANCKGQLTMNTASIQPSIYQTVHQRIKSGRGYMKPLYPAVAPPTVQRASILKWLIRQRWSQIKCYGSWMRMQPDLGTNAQRCYLWPNHCWRWLSVSEFDRAVQSHFLRRLNNGCTGGGVCWKLDHEFEFTSVILARELEE